MPAAALFHLEVEAELGPEVEQLPMPLLHRLERATSGGGSWELIETLLGGFLTPSPTSSPVPLPRREGTTELLGRTASGNRWELVGNQGNRWEPVLVNRFPIGGNRSLHGECSSRYSRPASVMLCRCNWPTCSTST